MRKKSVSSISRHPVYQRGNQNDGSPCYVFLSSDNESENEEEIILQPQNQFKSPPKKVEVINVSIKTDDTLQALALRYRCTISELKRINNIHKENEIFARRVIKVPVQPFSIFTENNEFSEDFTNGTKSKNNKTNTTVISEEITDTETPPLVFSTTDANINNVILNSSCEPLISEIEDNHLGARENDTLLNEHREELHPQSNIVDTFKCSGADWGLSWIHLLCFSLLLGFAGPVFYIFYIAENEHKHNVT